MAYLVRKISRAKWPSAQAIHLDEISADAVTGDLRTMGNTLSFWQLGAPSDNDEIRMIALALATGGERLDRLDLTWIDRDALDTQGIAVEESAGRTPVEKMRDKHVDLARLNLPRLCKVALLIAEALSLNHHRRFTKKQILHIIVEAIGKKQVSLTDLPPKIRREIEKKHDLS